MESIDIDDPDIKPVIPLNLCQLDNPLQLQVAALKIEPSSSVKDNKPQPALGPSRFAEQRGIRGAHLCHTPDRDLGPADPPRRRGRPKGSKSRPRIPVTFGLLTPPERAVSIKVRERLTRMTPPK